MDRRKFLRKTIPAATILPALIGGFSFKTAIGNTLMDTMTEITADTGRILVIVQLNGGNDGLNTIIPADQYGAYLKARSNIAVPENRILSLKGYDQTGMHPSMGALQSLFNEGRMNIIQSAGFESPTFSHFRDTEIWMSGSDKDKVENTGWAGRYLFETFAGAGNKNRGESAYPLAIQIGPITSLTFQGPLINMGMCVNNPTRFYNFINEIENPVPHTEGGDALEFVRLVARQTQHYGEVIKKAASRVTTQGTYPESELAAQLKTVARLIKGGLQTKIYMVTAMGYDTHAGQAVTHARLLKDLSDSIRAFTDDLQKTGWGDKVLGMTFSEFGRRIISNASGGTDHGAAAPLFLFGNNVTAGITGKNPVIPAVAGTEDNIALQYDFRSIYATILKNWFCVPGTSMQKILFKDFPSLPVLKNIPC
jgi:uncharacterized protein (DUF1501 family)